MNKHVNQEIGDISDSTVKRVNISYNETNDFVSNHNKKSLYCKSIILWILSASGFGMSLVLICCTYPRTDLQFDYLGIIMGILSLLVTTLGIFFAVNLFGIKNGIEDKIENFVNTQKCLLEQGLQNIENRNGRKIEDTKNVCTAFLHITVALNIDIKKKLSYTCLSFYEFNKQERICEVDKSFMSKSLKYIIRDFIKEGYSIPYSQGKDLCEMIEISQIPNAKEFIEDIESLMKDD